jgi:hypothetical protein
LREATEESKAFVSKHFDAYAQEYLSFVVKDMSSSTEGIATELRAFVLLLGTDEEIPAHIEILKALAEYMCHEDRGAKQMTVKRVYANTHHKAQQRRGAMQRYRAYRLAKPETRDVNRIFYCTAGTLLGEVKEEVETEEDAETE